MANIIPTTTTDIVALLVNIILIIFAFFIVDLVSNKGETTVSYWLRLLAVALILIFVPPVIITMFALIDQLFNNAIQTVSIAPYLVFVIGIYSVKFITVKQGKVEPKRTWENAIWMTFFSFLIILVIRSFIDWLASVT